MAIRSITAQRRYLNQIGDFESFKLLLDTLPDTAFFIKDVKGRVMLFNHRSCEIYNVHHESEILGKTDYDLHPKPLADKYTHDDRQVMRTRKPITNAIELAPNNSNRLVVYSKAPVFDRKGKVIGVAGVYRFVDDISDAPDWYGRFSGVIEYIHANYPKSLRLDDLAQRTNTSERQLERRFIKVFGIGIVDYILRVRINAALTLLETTTRTVSDIANAVGFYDHSHFIRNFKRLRGCSPKQYRALRAPSGL
ncbi:MAG: AraC family transcriptional regulator [Kiritimatiellaeota bacterium]|nr:AraC family transcriptional regulator [Kiritimatiellota bacterium]